MEFFRDRAAYGWNLLFPFMIIIGFSVMFNEDRQIMYKVGVIIDSNTTQTNDSEDISVSAIKDIQYRNFRKTKYIDFIEFNVFNHALDTLKHHRIDLLIAPRSKHYWLSRTSPKGYIVERLLKAGVEDRETLYKQKKISGREIPY